MKTWPLVLLLPGVVFAQGYRPNVSLQLTTFERVEEVTLGEDLSFRTLVLTKNEVGADTLVLLGGRLRLAPYEVNANAWLDFDVSTGFRLGNQLNIAAGAFLKVDNAAPARDSETLSIYGAHGLTLVPQASADACVSGKKGQSTTISGTGRTTYCDGTTNQTVAFVLSNTATVDFASMNTQDSDTKTVTITGAVTTDWVHCAPVSGGSMSGTDMHSTVTSADTVSILAHNDTNGTVDPPSMSVKCVIVR